MALVSGMGSSGQTYDDFIKEMNAAGIKTTNIREGEANFADYGNALSDDLKNQIMDSFDCKQDYELQAQIAGIYADSGRSVLQYSEFMNACKSLGLNVSVEYQKTSYIPDYKAGNYSNSVREGGAIAVYTISDGMGGEIVIADANGNAALESEELFMNQILGDINYEISATKGAGATLHSSGNGSSSDAVSGVEESQHLASEEESKETVEQKTYNTEVERYLEAGYSKSDAIAKVDAQLGVNNLTYTGNMEAIEKGVEELENIFLFEEEEEEQVA